MLSPYRQARLVTTGVITSLGLYSHFKKDSYPHIRVKTLRAIFTSYIFSDMLALAYLRRLSPTVFLHHVLFMTSALMSFEPFSGKKDLISINNIYPAACSCESMAFLHEIYLALNKKNESLFNLLHVVNIIFLRIPLWTYIYESLVPKVQSYTLTYILNTITHVIRLLDIYWAFCYMGLKKIIVREIKNYTI
jgi:hypothetical protein